MNNHPVIVQTFKVAQKLPLPLWIALIMVLPLSVGAVGLWLLNQTDVSGCQSVRQSLTAPDSTRLYCAQTIAQRQSASDLLEAIQIADAIAFDHPLRSSGDRLIKRWSERVVELAEGMVAEGQLNDAIDLVDKLPIGTPIYDSAKSRVQDWQATWNEAEAIYNEAQTALEEDKPTVALAEARKLLQLKNQYWSTTRFQELVNQIQASREEKRKVAKNQKLDNKEAKIADSKPLTTDNLLDSWQKEQETEARSHLSRAKELATTGTLDNLRSAISQAELILSGTSSYPQAQQLVEQWTRQIETLEDRPYLDRAAQLANKGDIVSLQSAISEANNIYFGRALYREAQGKIDQWTAQVQALHDQQYSQQLTPLPRNQFRETDYRISTPPSDR